MKKEINLDSGINLEYFTSLYVALSATLLSVRMLRVSFEDRNRQIVCPSCTFLFLWPSVTRMPLWKAEPFLSYANRRVYLRSGDEAKYKIWGKKRRKYGRRARTIVSDLRLTENVGEIYELSLRGSFEGCVQMGSFCPPMVLSFEICAFFLSVSAKMGEDFIFSNGKRAVCKVLMFRAINIFCGKWIWIAERNFGFQFLVQSLNLMSR